jgi:uncharacterized short protein YbdD (DUF466 family)
MKLYKVKESILENTDFKFKLFTYNYDYHKFVKIDDNWNVYTLCDSPFHIFRNSVNDPAVQLNVKDDMHYFTEVEQSKEKVLQEIKFLVGISDYESFDELETFDNAEDAVKRCIQLSEENENESYDVRVEYVYDYIYTEKT